MDELYDEALNLMEATLRLLEVRVPPPREIPHLDSFVFRYAERTIPQALVQKLARVISGLRACHILLEAGFVQEQAALQRTIDEFHEDISFLANALIFNEVTPLHVDYLDAFYQEEFDMQSAVDSTQKRPMPPRRKIRAFVARSGVGGDDPSTGVELSRTISKGYSGYVHGASPQIMDMLHGQPPRFQVRGFHGTERQEDHREDLWNYFFRSIIAFAQAAKAFGDDQLFERLRAFHIEFDRRSGRNASFSGET